MDSRLLFVATAMLLACAVESRNVVKRQAPNFNNNNNNVGGCSIGSSGVDPSDCSRFWECDDNGGRIYKMCGLGTFYDSQSGRCEWLQQGRNPGGCQINPLNDIKQEFRGLCGDNPNGNNSQAWHIPHPTWCNAFMTCSPNYIHQFCLFCGEGTFFPGSGGLNCGAYRTLDQAQSLCNGKPMVSHEDKVPSHLLPQCNARVEIAFDNPFSNNNNFQG